MADLLENKKEDENRKIIHTYPLIKVPTYSAVFRLSNNNLNVFFFTIARVERFYFRHLT